MQQKLSTLSTPLKVRDSFCGSLQLMQKQLLPPVMILLVMRCSSMSLKLKLTTDLYFPISFSLSFSC